MLKSTRNNDVRIVGIARIGISISTSPRNTEKLVAVAMQTSYSNDCNSC